ncbi:MAG: PD-(D/E)XK nuclease family protein [Campylobacterota bacterium]|nr:PD-(D/E)XK nuclease family protein [Campylobacterota bacterium]
MDNKTIVLPSARAIRHEQFLIDKQTLFLPNFITMSEFISKLCIVKNYKIVDDDTRTLLLLDASDFKAFSSLQIQRNFFTFTKNSSYIFKFFEELSAEKFDISNLENSDIYAEFEEHIEILQELYLRYEKLCNEKQILDKIFLPKLYKFNSLYASTHKEIELHINGHLTNFEFELLEKCSKLCDITIIFNTSIFNTKMQDKFLKLLGIELDANFRYKISLNTKSIIEKIPIIQNKNISCNSFSESLLQIAFVKQKVYEFIKKGYKPQNIAVILPNEATAVTLKLFDDKSNFNFAMGEGFNKTQIYEKLSATIQQIDQNTKENKARLDRVSDDVYVELLAIYFKNIEEVDVIEFLQKYKESFKSKREIKIFEEEIYSFKNILPSLKEMNIKSVLSLFLQRLSTRTLDDVRGGQITVMGVLETRSVEFDAIVIVDFNDSNVPKKSDKDMFLNTSIREMANLPTMGDRENLQKHYYIQLINSSKDVAISFVNSSDSSESRFLKHLGIKAKPIEDEQLYASILFQEQKSDIKADVEIVREYSFKGIKLSATRVKSFLTCKRKYFYNYVENLKGHKIPKDMPEEHEIGTAVHEALKNLYTKQNSYSDATKLKHDLDYELECQTTDNELDKYLIALQKKKMELFTQNEIKRFNDGWKVLSCEQNYECPFAGTTLVGQIDRVDKKENEIFVLDYKTGSYPLYTKNSFTDATDFQLEFYYLLAQSLGNVAGVAYYDLKESKIVQEAFLEEKLEILKSNIKDMLMLEEIEFSKCEDTKSCLFCDYKVICGRE